MGKLFNKKPSDISDNGRRVIRTDEIALALDCILESCDAIIRRTNGMTEEEFYANDDVLKASAMDMQIIGNYLGQFPLEIRMSSPVLDDAYSFRCRIAHDYGTVRFEMRYLWGAVHHDVYTIRDACLNIKEQITDSAITE